MENQSPRIDGYHAHVYYEPSTTRPTAEKLAETISQKFAVEIGGFFDEPVGPHPVANLAIFFAVTEFAAVVPWLMQNRNRLNVLVHPLTDNSVRDHQDDGLWLGAPVRLRLHRMQPGYTPDLLPSTSSKEQGN
jgi:aromatic ring-cleaving dioxygenase